MRAAAQRRSTAQKITPKLGGSKVVVQHAAQPDIAHQPKPKRSMLEQSECGRCASKCALRTPARSHVRGNRPENGVLHGPYRQRSQFRRRHLSTSRLFAWDFSPSFFSPRSVDFVGLVVFVFGFRGSESYALRELFLFVDLGRLL